MLGELEAGLGSLGLGGGSGSAASSSSRLSSSANGASAAAGANNPHLDKMKKKARVSNQQFKLVSIISF